jgi:hypothetical protein
LWPRIQGDVCGGNNVSEALVTFGAADDAPIEVTLTPQPLPGT